MTNSCSPWGTNDPAKGSQVLEKDPWDTTASEFTWHGTGSTTYTTTRGNNGIAQANIDGDSAYLNDYRPTASDLVFNYDLSLTETDYQKYSNASVTQLFYTANMYHDLLYLLGFNEAAGNFETNNNGQGGAGNDEVILNAQDGSGTNNANFATPVSTFHHILDSVIEPSQANIIRLMAQNHVCECTCLQNRPLLATHHSMLV